MVEVAHALPALDIVTNTLLLALASKLVLAAALAESRGGPVGVPLAKIEGDAIALTAALALINVVSLGVTLLLRLMLPLELDERVDDTEKLDEALELGHGLEDPMREGDTLTVTLKLDTRLALEKPLFVAVADTQELALRETVVVADTEALPLERALREPMAALTLAAPLDDTIGLLDPITLTVKVANADSEADALSLVE